MSGRDDDLAARVDALERELRTTKLALATAIGRAAMGIRDTTQACRSLAIAMIRLSDQDQVKMLASLDELARYTTKADTEAGVAFDRAEKAGYGDD